MRKAIGITLAVLVLSFAVLAQTPAPGAFDSTTINFSLTPVTLPGIGQTLAGAETDVLVNFTPNNVIGETTLISNSPFIGGRYERIIPSIAKFLQEHTALTGANFEAGFTVSLGVVDGSKPHWGERGGIFLKYAPSGSTNFNIGLDIEANNLPGVVRWAPSIALGPNFRF